MIYPKQFRKYLGEPGWLSDSCDCIEGTQWYVMGFQSSPLQLVSTNLAVIGSSAATAKMKSEPRFETPSP